MFKINLLNLIRVKWNRQIVLKNIVNYIDSLGAETIFWFFKNLCKKECKKVQKNDFFLFFDVISFVFYVIEKINEFLNL